MPCGFRAQDAMAFAVIEDSGIHVRRQEMDQNVEQIAGESVEKVRAIGRTMNGEEAFRCDDWREVDRELCGLATRGAGRGRCAVAARGVSPEDIARGRVRLDPRVPGKATGIHAANGE